MHEKRRKALKTIKTYVWLTGAAGFIPIHYLDWAAVSGLQLKMLAKISKIYDVPFQENLGKAAIASLAGFAIPHAAAVGTIGSLLKAIPGMGGVAGAPLTAVFAGAYSWALGNMFIQHFESGGTFLNFRPREVKEYFKTQFEEARRISPNGGLTDAPSHD
jgi:uncharacterized protein (DUF697 family)